MRVWPVLLTLLLALLPGCFDGDSTTGILDSNNRESFVWDALAGYVDYPPNGNVVDIDLYITEGHVFEPFEGSPRQGFAFGFQPDGSDASIPGPEIRLTQGDTLRATLHMAADHIQPHTIHWHGITLPWEMDGVPMVTQEVKVGEDWTYTYEWVAREPGTYWYHCHVEAPAHVDLGMLGALIVDPADGSHDPPHDRDYTLLLHEQDSRTGALFAAVTSGQLPEIDPTDTNPIYASEDATQNAAFMADILGFIAHGASGQETWAEGSEREYYPFESVRYRPMYDTFMINGKSYPDTEVLKIADGETVRIRLINAGTQPHSMHLHGHHFLVTHKDGYLLNSPYAADTILLGAGERYDIYVAGYNAGIWDFHDHGGGYMQGGFASNDYAFPGGMATMLVYEDFVGAELPKVDPAAARARDFLPFLPQ